MTLKPEVADENLRLLSRIQYNSTTLTAFHYFDNFNQRYFPTKGFRSRLEVSATPSVNGKITMMDSLTLDADELEGLLQTADIYTLDLILEPIIPVTRRLSLLAKARLRLSTIEASTLNLNEYDFIGGFVPGRINANEYWGGNAREFAMTYYFYGRVGLQWEVLR